RAGLGPGRRLRGRGRHDHRRGRGRAREDDRPPALPRRRSAREGRARGPSRRRALDGAGRRALCRAERVVSRQRRRPAVVASPRIDGNSLTIADIVSVARRGTPVALDRASEQLVRAAAKLVAEVADGDDPIYGVNTGFGELSRLRIQRADLAALQLNLLRSHAAGVGEPLPDDVVRAVLLLRANTLAVGRSGVRAETIDLLLDLLNRGVHPVIPMHGSVGASGDLAPLAHAALVLV